MSTLGSRIKDARKSKGLTLRALAELAKVDAGYISALEAGKRTPGGEKSLALMKLSDVLGVSLAPSGPTVRGRGAAAGKQKIPFEARYFTASMIILGRLTRDGDADSLKVIFELLQRIGEWNRADQRRVIEDNEDHYPQIRDSILIPAGLL